MELRRSHARNWRFDAGSAAPTKPTPPVPTSGSGFKGIEGKISTEYPTSTKPSK